LPLPRRFVGLQFARPNGLCYVQYLGS
jgi:hypothetical protein